MKIISFSLWGKDEKYLRGAVDNVLEARIIYPDWTCVFFVRDDVPMHTQDVLARLRAIVIPVNGPYKGEWEGLFWRFWVINFLDVDYAIIRDTDSKVNSREKAAVDAWIASGRPFHTMRDHIQHTTVPICGGMWGCVGGYFANIEDEIENYNQYNIKGCDQSFLSEIVWPVVQDNCIVHDKYDKGITIDNYSYSPISFFGEHDVRPFPEHAPIRFGTHVGEIINDDVKN